MEYIRESWEVICMLTVGYFFLSYLIGCIMFGYIIGRLFGKMDIRQVGSGNVGARNIGRSLNRSAFVATFLGDAGKGAAAILLGRAFGFSEEIQLIGFLFVLIGHIWPITLGFKGGKGISSFLGGIIAFEPTVTIVILVCFAITYPFFRSFTLSGLLSLSSLPIYLFIDSHTYPSVGIIILAVITILFAHRTNIKERV
jgi:acyl phosphate:glycerol-3-phosphate acyltransferase